MKVYDLKKLKNLAANEKDQLLNDAYELGFKYEHDYHGCSQSALGALQELFGIHNNDVFKASCGLAGGIGASSQSTCGALAGVCIFLSLLYGRERDKIKDVERRRFIAYNACNKVLENCIEEFGTTECWEIQKDRLGRSYKLIEPEEFKIFEEAGGHETVCPDTVGKITQFAVKVILEMECGK